MKRKALIIGSPDKEIPGVYADMENYKNYLLSATGGLWDEKEISVIESPRAAQVRLALMDLKNADYSFLVFAGHGAYSVPSKTTYVNLNSAEIFDVNLLRLGAEKHTLIVDACRDYDYEPIPDTRFMLKATFESAGSADLARHLFDEHVEKCRPGFVGLYACSRGQGAGDTSNGGLFSSILLDEAYTWSETGSASSNILQTDDVLHAAKPRVFDESAHGQIVDYYFSRTGPRFPFAVRT